MDVGINNIKFILPVFCFAGAVFGLWHYLKIVENNGCDMTYMFEHPEYLKIPLNYSSAVKFPRYNLFIYGEGKYAEDLSAQRYQGMPVLFIPGNGGSHRQVRSLASVALRMSLSHQTTLHFNFFTVDFNEEISALYGGTLKDQTEFVQECVKHIQALYRVKKKLILIGHSMGGIIAKAVFSLKAFNPSDVSLILTLASPHRKPVIAMDYAIVAFYEQIKTTWRYRQKSEFRNIPMISIGGGQRDSLVKSDLIFNDFEHNSDLDFHVLTPSIPGVWVSTDHLAIVWCKQLVLTICRSLLDFSSLDRKKVTKDPSVVKSLLHFHYVSRGAGNHWPSPWHNPFQSFPSSGQWIEEEGSTFRFSRVKVLSSVYILIPLLHHANVVVLATGLSKEDWIFGCTKLSTAETKTCVEGENLSHKGEIIPSRKAGSERRMVQFQTQDLKAAGYVSLLIYIAPVDSQVEILGETFFMSERVKHYTLPSLFERLFSRIPHRIFTISLMDQVAYYNVTIPRSAGVFEGVVFQLETRLCRAGSVVGQGIVKMDIPWNKEHSFYHIRTALGGVTTMPVQVHSLPLFEISPDVNLLFILDPECNVVLTARFPFYLIASQFIKFYGPYIVGYTVAVLLVLLSDQLYTFGLHGTSSSIYRMFGQYPSFLNLVFLPAVLYHFHGTTGISVPILPDPDELDPSYSFFSALILRTLLYLVAGGLVFCASILMELLLKGMFFGWIYVMEKHILQTTQVPLEQVSKKKVSISRVMLACSSVLAAISVSSSSSLAVMFTCIYYLFKLASMYTRCKLEEERRGSNAATCRWYFHLILVLLWMVALLLTGPGLVMWVKNLKYSMKISNNVYVLPCTLMIVSSAILWQLPTPIISRYKYGAAARLIQAVAVVTTLYGISSVHRLLYYVAFAFLTISFQQTLAYFHGLTSLKGD